MNFKAMAQDNIEIKNKLKKLSKLEFLAEQSVRGATAPAIKLAFNLGTAVIVLILILGIIFAEESSLVEAAMGLAFTLLVSFGVVILVARFSNWPLSWDEALDDELASYSPVDIEAYRALQKQIKAVGRFDPETIIRWVEVEKKSLQPAIDPLADSAFLNKSV